MRTTDRETVDAVSLLSFLGERSVLGLEEGIFMSGSRPSEWFLL